MRNIVIDIGNTRTKLGVFEQGQLIARFDALSEQLLSDMGITAEDRILVSSVGHGLEEARRLLTGWDYLEFDRSVSIPLQLDYETPETLGLDRIAAAVGATVLFPESALLVMDMGSCITADLVTADGRYQGGVISPGIRMRFKAMHAFTEKLPSIEWSAERVQTPLPGRSTRQCMESGVLKGVQFELEGYISHYTAIHPGLKVVMTGGDAQYFENIINTPIFTEDSLVLIGLNRVLEYNVV